jgi:hypothetical protein
MQLLSNNSSPLSIIMAIMLLFPQSACKKLVGVPAPVNQVISDEVFKNDAPATAAITGIYSEMMATSNQFAAGATTFYTGLSSDELYYYSSSFRDEFLSNNITQSNHAIISQIFWDRPYKYIYIANLAVEKLNTATDVSEPVKKRLLGEARFIRAFCYFHLVNLFGDVPLITSSDYSANATMPRTVSGQVWQQVIDDLTEAEILLPAAYATTERTRPNKWTAAALLARAFLYNGKFAEAEQKATAVISAGVYSLVSSLNNVFLKNCPEAIWQLPPSNTLWNTWEAREMVPATASALPQYLVTAALRNAFELNDKRKTSWLASRVYAGQTLYYPYKYKVYGNGAPVTEYYMVLRLAEQYLIRAEARAHQNDIAGAQSDLNIIRSRAGLPATTAADKSALLAAIEQERRVELFAEWGHRWFDLKRTGRANDVLGILKPSTWQPADILWPIPIGQLNANPFLTQNPGY